MDTYKRNANGVLINTDVDGLNAANKRKEFINKVDQIWMRQNQILQKLAELEKRIGNLEEK